MSMSSFHYEKNV